MGEGMEEGTCCDEHWVLGGGAESIHSTEASIALGINKLEFK